MPAKNPRPCLPLPAVEPPSGPGWVHEIKHDGFRIIALRSEDRVRLFTRNGYDFAARFPKIVAAVKALPLRSCLIDGEAIVLNADGLSVFDLLRHRRHDDAAILCAFDLIELDGKNLKWSTLENRKELLADVLKGTVDGIAFNAHFDCDGATIFEQACIWAARGSYRSA
jgi:bifunctional non-homologous end joining protein LigD